MFTKLPTVIFGILITLWIHSCNQTSLKNPESKLKVGAGIKVDKDDLRSVVSLIRLECYKKSGSETSSTVFFGTATKVTKMGFITAAHTFKEEEKLPPPHVFLYSQYLVLEPTLLEQAYRSQTKLDALIECSETAKKNLNRLHHEVGMGIFEVSQIFRALTPQKSSLFKSWELDIASFKLKKATESIETIELIDSTLLLEQVTNTNNLNFEIIGGGSTHCFDTSTVADQYNFVRQIDQSSHFARAGGAGFYKGLFITNSHHVQKANRYNLDSVFFFDNRKPSATTVCPGDSGAPLLYKQNGKYKLFAIYLGTFFRNPNKEFIAWRALSLNSQAACSVLERLGVKPKWCVD